MGYEEVLSTETGILLERESEDRFWLNMGPQHPSTHGVFRVLLETEGEMVVKVIPIIGYLHRAVEKLSENRQYLGALPLTDRMDYLAAMFNNMALTRSVETIMGTEVPVRAQWLRVLALELNRLASHLLFYGTMGLDLGALTPFFHAFRERERVQYVLEMMSGQRITFNYIRYGGVRGDLTTGMETEIRKFMETFRPSLKEYRTLLLENEIFASRMKGVGVAPLERLLAYGVTGPIARASGHDWDLRRDDPHDAYPEFRFEVPVAHESDCFARWWVRLREMEESAAIVEQCLDGLPAGEHVKRMPFFFKPPKGEAYTAIETPRGELGTYVISDGTVFPYRVRYRAPSFCNLMAITELLQGKLIGDVVAILGSFDPVFGEVDR